MNYSAVVHTTASEVRSRILILGLHSCVDGRRRGLPGGLLFRALPLGINRNLVRTARDNPGHNTVLPPDAVRVGEQLWAVGGRRPSHRRRLRTAP